MKVLVIGNGGREHALAWKAASRRWLRLFLLLRVMQALRWNRAAKRCYRRDRYPGAVGFRKNEKIDLTIVGPEAPLVKGVSIPSALPG